MKNLKPGERVRLLKNVWASHNLSVADGVGSVEIYDAKVRAGSLGEVIGFRSPDDGAVLFKVSGCGFRVTGDEDMFERVQA